MRALIALIVVLGACTPPPVYREGYEPPPQRAGVAHEPGPSGTLSGRTGPASGAAGLAFFSTSNQMYQAFAELIGGTVSQGKQTYDFELDRTSSSDEQTRAIAALQARATRSARREARDQGCVLVRVAFNAGPPDPDGSFLLRVTSLLEDPKGVRHTEVRDGVVRPRSRGEAPDFQWLGPARDVTQ